MLLNRLRFLLVALLVFLVLLHCHLHFFFFNDTATTKIYSLSLHDALPIFGAERIIERLPGTRELSMTFLGVDPIFEPIPVRPGAHYHMGGVETDVWGLTELEGLYAAGECACVSVHGAIRLGGNALMETITYGKRSGRHP